MKTRYLRVWALAVVSGATLVSAGCAKTQVRADEVPVFTKEEPAPEAAAESKDDGAGAPAAEPTTTNAAPAAKVVQTPTTPQELQLTPGLAEVIKLAQAGVSEEIILTYITNSGNIYNVGSAEIVYLNDLGVSATVIRELIRQDNSPETKERKRALTAASPLPPGVALNSPATNIYYTTPKPSSGNAAADVPATAPLVDPNAGEVATTEQAPAPAAAVVAQSPDVSYFYSSLSPYGSWVQVENYGLCWQPTVAVVNSAWRPYADHGRWYWSDAGWYWYSDYSWGWAPFHYGRWASAPRLGWFWVPDTVWGPSWVTWRYGSSYCGWAPLPPYSRYSSGFGLVYRNNSVGFGFGFGFGADAYTFVPWNRFHDHSPHRFFARHSDRSVIFRNTTVVNNYVVGDNNTIVNEGFGVDRVARHTGTRIGRVAIRNAALPTDRTVRPERLVNDGSSLAVVRPELPRRPSIQTTRSSLDGRTSPTSLGTAAANPSQENKTVKALFGTVSRSPRSASQATTEAEVTRPNSTLGASTRQNNGAPRNNPSLLSAPGVARTPREYSTRQIIPGPSATPSASQDNGGRAAGEQSSEASSSAGKPADAPRNVPEVRSRIARAPFQAVSRPSSSAAVPVWPGNSENAQSAHTAPRRQGFQTGVETPGSSASRVYRAPAPVVNRPQAVANSAPAAPRTFQPFSAPVRRDVPVARPQVQMPVHRPTVIQSAPAAAAPAPVMRSAPVQRQSQGSSAPSRPSHRPTRIGGRE